MLDFAVVGEENSFSKANPMTPRALKHRIRRNAVFVSEPALVQYLVGGLPMHDERGAKTSFIITTSPCQRCSPPRHGPCGSRPGPAKLDDVDRRSIR